MPITDEQIQELFNQARTVADAAASEKLIDFVVEHHASIAASIGELQKDGVGKVVALRNLAVILADGATLCTRIANRIERGTS